jgi:hypothetical protein
MHMSSYWIHTRVHYLVGVVHTLASMHTNSYVVVIVDLVSAYLDLKKWIGEGLNNRTRTMQTIHTLAFRRIKINTSNWIILQ